ncbi:MAG: zinc ABC transporter substrate-binding protein [Gemmatimonadetes bacterium]|nr:zinc ABC transporter substrate-binding protein [Gemmatimonadota bacterium]
MISYALVLLTAVAPVLARPAVHSSDGPEPPARVGPAPLRVVTTLSVYASIAREIGGNEVEVMSIASPVEDAHFVRPKPSFALELRRADLFVSTGLDLELWVPPLLDKAGNARVIEGATGYVATYPGIQLLDIPAVANRSQGDIHIFGNPHLHTDPLRAVQIARNITTGLKKVAPDRAPTFDQRLASFTDRIYRRLFGDELVDALGGETLEKLARSGNLFAFLDSHALDGEPLVHRLGGWLAAAAPFRGKEIVCYHKDWAYFEDRFQIHCAEFVEPKPGIPPTPGHVARVIQTMQQRGVRVVLAANYYDRNKVEAVARRGNGVPVIVTLYPGGMTGVNDYFALVDHWVAALADAFRKLSS